MEGCSVFVAAQPTEFNIKSLPNALNVQRSNLDFPVEKLQAMDEQSKLKDDIHMVFEYAKGDRILGFEAPRSNRLYFVHDPNGGKITQFENYHSLVS